MNQKQRVLEYMKDFGVVTPYHAFRDLGVTRLAAVIYRLKQDGHLIGQEWHEGKNRYNEKVHYMTYWLEESEK